MHGFFRGQARIQRVVVIEVVDHPGIGRDLAMNLDRIIGVERATLQGRCKTTRVIQGV